MMSHELRTPLNVVLGVAEAMQDASYGPIGERQQRALGQISESGRHLLGILSDMLDLARIGAGAEQLELESTSVERVCGNALQLVRERAQKKQLRLVRTVDVGVDHLRADERRLTQILVNLLENAVKFTPAGGAVGLEVRGRAAEEQIAFTVWDTGIGIAGEDLGRLFKPFSQVDGRLNRSYEGVGLGLTLVRQLVELHGGSVQLESSPGAGSRFTVTLPWQGDDNVAATAPALPEAPRAWARAPRVLVADDHEATLELYALRLQREGCEVLQARTGAEALELLRRERPDAAVLDVQMPELSGLEAIARVRADAELATLPIIAVSALAMPGDRERGLAAGASRYLAKPVGGRALIAAIAELLG